MKQWISDLTSSDPKIKYPASRQLIAISETDPHTLYDNFDSFVDLLGSANNIMKWTALQILGNLSRVDAEGKIDKVYLRIVAALDTGKLITANNAIYTLTQIAKADPAKTDDVVSMFLKIKGYEYDTPECSNIAIGKIILALDELFDQASDKEAILAFVRNETKNSRPATAKKAEQFLRKRIP